eukprot:1045922-Pyramimonas_sp.AAC.1
MGVTKACSAWVYIDFASALAFGSCRPRRYSIHSSTHWLFSSIKTSEIVLADDDPSGKLGAWE